MEQSLRRADQREFHYIYKITRHDGKYYIGLHSTDVLDDGYFGSGQLLWRSINKHGRDNHVKIIIEFLPNRKDLKMRERELVNEQTLKDPLCLNLCLGGGGSDFTTENTKRKMSEAAKIGAVGRNPHPQTDATRLKISKALKGKTKTAEHIAKIVSSKLTRMTDETRMKLGSGNRGKPMSEEQKAKLSAKLKSKPQGPKPKWTDERRAKRSAEMKEYWAAKDHCRIKR